MGGNQKVNYIKSYIQKCDIVYETKNISQAEKLCDDILAIFESEIPTIKNDLSMYLYSDVDYLEDLHRIREKLQLHVINIEADYEKREIELEKLKLQQITVNNHNSNTNTSNSKSSTSIVLTIDQVFENISEMPDSILSSDEKEQLKDLIDLLEAEVRRKNKEGFGVKLKKVLKYISDKSVEVGVAVLPYLGQISSMFAAV